MGEPGPPSQQHTQGFVPPACFPVLPVCSSYHSCKVSLKAVGAAPWEGWGGPPWARPCAPPSYERAYSCSWATQRGPAQPRHPSRCPKSCMWFFPLFFLSSKQSFINLFFFFFFLRITYSLRESRKPPFCICRKSKVTWTWSVCSNSSVCGPGLLTALLALGAGSCQSVVQAGRLCLLNLPSHSGCPSSRAEG